MSIDNKPGELSADTAAATPPIKILGGVAVVLGVLGLVAAWGLGWFSAEPAPVSLETAIESASPTTEADPGQVAEPSTTVAVPVQSVSDLTGTWNIEESDATFVGYRIAENLSGADIEAVGRSRSVSGVLVAEGSSISSVTVEVSMLDLTSDSRIRDSQMKSQALEVTQFPTATFELTRPIDVGEIPIDGEGLAFVATGNLNLHGVTKAIDVPLQAATTDGKLIVVGAIDILLADFEIDKPEAPTVASVSDTATMELSLLFSR